MLLRRHEVCGLSWISEPGLSKPIAERIVTQAVRQRAFGALVVMATSRRARQRSVSDLSDVESERALAEGRRWLIAIGGSVTPALCTEDRRLAHLAVLGSWGVPVQAVDVLDSWLRLQAKAEATR